MPFFFLEKKLLPNTKSIKITNNYKIDNALGNTSLNVTYSR